MRSEPSPTPSADDLLGKKARKLRKKGRGPQSKQRSNDGKVNAEMELSAPEPRLHKARRVQRRMNGKAEVTLNFWFPVFAFDEGEREIGGNGRAAGDRALLDETPTFVSKKEGRRKNASEAGDDRRRVRGETTMSPSKLSNERRGTPRGRREVPAQT